MILSTPKTFQQAVNHASVAMAIIFAYSYVTQNQGVAIPALFEPFVDILILGCFLYICWIILAYCIYSIRKSKQRYATAQSVTTQANDEQINYNDLDFTTLKVIKPHDQDSGVATLFYSIFFTGIVLAVGLLPIYDRIRPELEILAIIVIVTPLIIGGIGSVYCWRRKSVHKHSDLEAFAKQNHFTYTSRQPLSTLTEQLDESQHIKSSALATAYTSITGTYRDYRFMMTNIQLRLLARPPKQGNRRFALMTIDMPGTTYDHEQTLRKYILKNHDNVRAIETTNHAVIFHLTTNIPYDRAGMIELFQLFDLTVSTLQSPHSN